MKRIEYKLVSSVANGISEVYIDKEELKNRINYITMNKEMFKSNRMIYVYGYVYNENDKIVYDRTLQVIDLREI